MSPDPTTPMDDKDLADVRAVLTEAQTDPYWPGVVRALLARLDAAEADLKAEIEDANELVELFKMALAERDAALASPEGVATLDGKQWRVVPGGFGFDNGDQTARLVPYRRPEDTKGGDNE